MALKTILFLYAAIGFAILIFVYIKNLEDKPNAWAREVLEAINPRKKTLKDYLSDLLVYSIAITIILIAWPIFLIWVAFESYQEGGIVGKLLGNKQMSYERYPFECRPENLICEITPEEAENEGEIFDPLNTTPAEPFGYLHQVWIDFLSGHDHEETLWKFAVNPDPTTRSKKHCSGYAWVKDGKITAEFLVEC